MGWGFAVYGDALCSLLVPLIIIEIHPCAVQVVLLIVVSIPDAPYRRCRTETGISIACRLICLVWHRLISLSFLLITFCIAPPLLTCRGVAVISDRFRLVHGPIFHYPFILPIPAFRQYARQQMLFRIQHPTLYLYGLVCMEVCSICYYLLSTLLWSCNNPKRIHQGCSICVQRGNSIIESGFATVLMAISVCLTWYRIIYGMVTSIVAWWWALVDIKPCGS